MGCLLGTDDVTLYLLLALNLSWLIDLGILDWDIIYAILIFSLLISILVWFIIWLWRLIHVKLVIHLRERRWILTRSYSLILEWVSVLIVWNMLVLVWFSPKLVLLALVFRHFPLLKLILLWHLYHILKLCLLVVNWWAEVVLHLLLLPLVFLLLI